jgi:predicted TIM-barrel fold metal-dependent hydrolase
MKIDACAFLGESLRRNSVSVEDLKKQMDENGVDRSVVRPLVPPDYDYDKANKTLAEAVKKDERLIGFARVNPWEDGAPAQVGRAAKYGLRGVHLHPWEENFLIHADMLDDTIKAARDENFLVYVSTGYPCVSEPLQLLELALRFPGVTFIATHAAQLDMSGNSFDDALVLAENAPNVLYDLSGVYRRDFIERLLAVGDSKNVVFGSCSPYMDCRMEIERINAARIPQEHKEAIFYRNISRVLNL